MVYLALAAFSAATASWSKPRSCRLYLLPICRLQTPYYLVYNNNTTTSQACEDASASEHDRANQLAHRSRSQLPHSILVESAM
jgi:hypothetical protein